MDVDPRNQAPDPGRPTVLKCSVDGFQISEMGQLERVGRIEKFESFTGELTIDEEEVNGFLRCPVGIPIETAIVLKAGEGVVVD